MSGLLARTGLHLTETLRFVESDVDWSVYVNPDGDEVLLAHGTGVRLVAFDELDLPALWSEFRNTGARYDTEGFRDHLRGLTTDTDEVDEVAFCDDCWDVHADRDDFTYTGHETWVCDECVSEYWHCNDCEQYFRNTTTTLSDTEVCQRCRDRNWSHCEDCDGWYRDEYADEHNHQDGCDCESPAQQFTIRNDGEEPLGNDTRVTVTLPAGVIDSEGINAIRRYLRDFARTIDDGTSAGQLRAVASRIEELGEKWQTRDGNYTKRLSRFAYNTYQFKVPPEVVSQVGVIARNHSTAVNFAIEVTRDLNQSAEDFAHEESCWWQSYYHGRCALKTNGGFGLRTFVECGTGDYKYDQVSGRAWVMPLRLNEDNQLRPTFNTETPDAFVVFNGYGDLEGYAPARIVSHMAGMTYRKITFTCDPMYVNSSAGYLVAPEEIATNYTDGSLALYVEQHARLYTNEKKVLTNA